VPTVTHKRKTTLLQHLMIDRRLTHEQTVEVLHRRAQQLGVHDFTLTVRQLNRWLAGQTARPRLSVCRVVEAEFGRRIEELLNPYQPRVFAGRPLTRTSARASRRELRTEPLVGWLADHSTASFEELWVAVALAADRLDGEKRPERIAQLHRRARVPRAAIAQAVASYYGRPDGLYRIEVDRTQLTLSILTRRDWTGLAVELGGDAEQPALVAPAANPPSLQGAGLQAAITRLAEVEVSDTVLVNDSIYALAGVQVAHDRLAPQFRVADFAAYALTADLLEEELLDTLAGYASAPPLRELYLASIEATLDLESRLCAGGPACLFAIARPEGDYALPIQRRSRQVVNVAGRMAVVPKAFHQSISNTTTEAHVGATIWRELEEELLGRQELEQLAASSRRRAAPDHPRNRTEPVAWLHENPCSRLECAGFGINLVSGNYEFACLLTIDDERWWETFGHRVQANWEAMDLHCYSSRDPQGLTRLMADPAWSNEGLFALIEGLRRLDAITSSRVDIPPIEISLP
jgi:hypothetical protein